MKKAAIFGILGVSLICLSSCSFHLGEWYPFGKEPQNIRGAIFFMKDDSDMKGDDNIYYGSISLYGISTEGNSSSSSEGSASDECLLPINKSIYVGVIFLLENDTDADSTVLFEVSVPFSNIIYCLGEVVPKKSGSFSDGTSAYLSGMLITVKSKQTIMMEYCFEIEGKTAHSNLNFACYFTHYKGAVLDSDSSWKKSFDFVAS